MAGRSVRRIVRVGRAARRCIRSSIWRCSEARSSASRCRRRSSTSAAMFGATLFIPLFVQSVLGSSATDSGQDPDAPHAVASAHGDYRRSRHQPDRALSSVRDRRDAAVAHGRRVLAHQDGSFDELPVLVRNVAIVGVGLGAAMPVFNLAVQNAVEARDGRQRDLHGSVRALDRRHARHRRVRKRSRERFLARHSPGSACRRRSPKFRRRRSRALADAQLYLTSAGSRQLETILARSGLHTDAVTSAIRQAARTALSASLHDVFARRLRDRGGAPALRDGAYPVSPRHSAPQDQSSRGRSERRETLRSLRDP